MKRLVVLLTVAVLAGCSGGSDGSSSHSSITPASTTTSTFPEQRCDGSMYDTGRCMAGVLADLDEERAGLVATLPSTLPSTLPPGAPTDLPAEWQQTERAFEAYRDQACDTVYLEVIDGSIRTLDALSCEIDLTRDHLAFLRAQQ